MRAKRPCINVREVVGEELIELGQSFIPIAARDGLLNSKVASFDPGIIDRCKSDPRVVVIGIYLKHAVEGFDDDRLVRRDRRLPEPRHFTVRVAFDRFFKAIKRKFLITLVLCGNSAVDKILRDQRTSRSMPVDSALI